MNVPIPVDQLAFKETLKAVMREIPSKVITVPITTAIPSQLTTNSLAQPKSPIKLNHIIIGLAILLLVFGTLYFIKKKNEQRKEIH